MKMFWRKKKNVDADFYACLHQVLLTLKPINFKHYPTLKEYVFFVENADYDYILQSLNLFKDFFVVKEIKRLSYYSITYYIILSRKH